MIYVLYDVQADYVLDGQNVAEEIVKHRTSSTASWGTATTISYLQGASGPLYRLSSAATDPSWYVYDGLGSVVGEVSVTGALTASESRDVYGNLRTSAGTKTTSHGFVGGLGHQTDDETGLVYMRARYYDPQIGRFTSEDHDKSGNNWYAYVDDTPTNKADSTGHFAEWMNDLIASLGITLGGGALTAAGWGMWLALQAIKVIPVIANFVSFVAGICVIAGVVIAWALLHKSCNA